MVANAPETDNFSYAAPDDPRLKRMVIRAIEGMTGQPHLKRLYDQHRQNPRRGETFLDAAIRLLQLHINCNEDALACIPKTGPLVIVANHPYGVLDGLVICHLVAKIRDDFRILTNSVLYRAEEIRGNLLPIDFAETKEAQSTNLQSRSEAKQYLMQGGCLVIFPAGGAATTPRPWNCKAIDLEWKPFTARLITQAKAPVVPLYFAGQNSRLFQLASHVSMTLRLSLFFKEVYDRIGSEIRVRIGQVIPYQELADLDRKSLMDHLRRATFALAASIPPPLKR